MAVRAPLSPDVPKIVTPSKLKALRLICAKSSSNSRVELKVAISLSDKTTAV